jgi:hypothetical protein
VHAALETCLWGLALSLTPDPLPQPWQCSKLYAWHHRRLCYTSDRLLSLAIRSLHDAYCCSVLCCLQCPESAWSLTYNASFWKDSYCPNASTGQQEGACAADNPQRPAACDLDVPPEGRFLYPDAVFALCPELFDAKRQAPENASPLQTSTFQSTACGCLADPSLSEADAITLANSMNGFLNFNYTSGVVIPPTNVTVPAECPDAAFVPALDLYTCNAVGVNFSSPDACMCPFAISFSGFDIASAGCIAFITAAAEGGTCLTSESATDSGIGRCRISSCPCLEDVPPVLRASNGTRMSGSRARRLRKALSKSKP